MSKWLFWRVSSGNLKTQNFVCVKSVGQKIHYFRLYMTQKTLINLYEYPLFLCFIKKENDKNWWFWKSNSEILSNSTSGYGWWLFWNHRYFMPYFKKVLAKDIYNVFSYFEVDFCYHSYISCQLFQFMLWQGKNHQMQRSTVNG